MIGSSLRGMRLGFFGRNDVPEEPIERGVVEELQNACYHERGAREPGMAHEDAREHGRER